MHPEDDEAWRAHVQDLISNRGGVEDQRMREWLIGLTKKTAQNLGLKDQEYPAVFKDVMRDIENVAHGTNARSLSLMLWGGAATLTVRGSRKSKIGKQLERTIVRAALTIIGLSESEGDFRLNMSPDAEVVRETDAEIRTHRGYVRMEVGLIGAGNPEVIGDKIARLDRNEIVLVDLLPSKSTTYKAAGQKGVKLIILRNNHPVEELRRHLCELGVAVQKDEITPEEVKSRVRGMPISSFRLDSLKKEGRPKPKSKKRQKKPASKKKPTRT